MNQSVIIFESKYGSTKRYAQWIAGALSCPIFEKKNFCPKDFKKYDIIIYGGGLYAGGVSGIRLLIQNWELLSDKKVILFTCGLADPAEPVNVSHIREALSKTLPSEIIENIKTFHLRGGIDYPRLSFVHKAMMSMLRKMLLKKDPSELSNEDLQLLDSYGKKMDFTDSTAIQPIVEYIHNIPDVKP